MADKKFTGKVVKRAFGKSSKSEHDAVMLDTGKREFKLRRVGGNPFRDDVLEAMVGKQVECLGTAIGSVLIFDEWSETDQETSTQTGPEGSPKPCGESKSTKKTASGRVAKTPQSKQGAKHPDTEP